MAYKQFGVSNDRECGEHPNSYQGNDRLIDRVCEHLALPDTTFLGTRITKKMLIDSSSDNGNALSASDKKLVTDVIKSIEWQNTLKPETINIPAYVTEEVEYVEVAVIRLVLKNSLEEKKGKLKSNILKKLSKLLHGLIPYPVILLVEQQDDLAISLADKRINQVDKSKLVIEHIYSTDWLNKENLSHNENEFLNDFSLNTASNLNYFEFYQDFISMLISLEASRISGCYTSKYSNDSVSEEPTDISDSVFVGSSNEDKTTLLRELESLEASLSSIRNKLKKETQMKTKMRMNVEAKNIKQTIASIKEQLS